VLASAQKVHILAAVAECIEANSDFVNTQVPFSAVMSHYLSGTDDGAHERALLADGFDSSGPLSGTISVSRLLVHALHYSSNAAVDALADAVVDRAPCTSLARELPPRMSAQFVDAYLGGDEDWQFLNRPLTPECAVAGWNTFTSPVTALTSAVQFITSRRNRERLLRYLPRVGVYNVGAIRGKLGELPGHRAGTLVRRDVDGEFIVGSYALSNFPLRPQERALADAVEYVLRAAAVRAVTAPFVTYLPRPRRDT
jgi:hypothetical protein